MARGGSWWSLVAPGGSWWLLVAPGGPLEAPWKLLMVSGGSSCLLVALGGPGWLLLAGGERRPANGGPRKGFTKTDLGVY